MCRSHLSSPQSYAMYPKLGEPLKRLDSVLEQKKEERKRNKKKVLAEVTSQDRDRLRSRWSLLVCLAYLLCCLPVWVQKQHSGLATELAKRVYSVVQAD